MALSTAHSIHTSQCTETVCEVLNTLLDIVYKYLEEQDELCEQYIRVDYQCHLSNADCDKKDELYNEVIQISEALDEIEKVLATYSTVGTLLS